MSILDYPDGVEAGRTLTYRLTFWNAGPWTPAPAHLTQTLPPQVAFLSSTPGPPTCTETGGTFSCDLSVGGAGQTVTLRVRVDVGTSGTIQTDATVSGWPDPNPSNNHDLEVTTVIRASESELVHGSTLWADLESVGGVPDDDLYRIGEKRYSSYEVVVDGTSGDIGTGQGPDLDRMAWDATTVLQSSVPGAGASRSLRWENDTAALAYFEYVRVRSAGCTTTCGPEDVYRIRSWDTTLAGPRFNNSSTQLTVLVLQNTADAPVSGHAHFWDTAGVLLGTQALTLGPKAAFVLDTSTVAGVAGQGGTITLSHDGPYAMLAGKAVAVEPATGFTFDTPLVPRPR